MYITGGRTVNYVIKQTNAENATPEQNGSDTFEQICILVVSKFSY